MAFTIQPLSNAPQTRPDCIGWVDAEWGAGIGFTSADWEREFDRILAHPVEEIFVAMQEGTPVGMVWFLEQEDIETHKHLTPWLSSLVVAPHYRGRGVGKALMAHVENYAGLGGTETLHLLTDSPSFYVSNGWTAADTAYLGARHVFVMEKDLV